MNKDLLKIKNDTIYETLADLTELEEIVHKIIEKYHGLNFNSIVAMYHQFDHSQIEVNGDTLFEGNACYADSDSFSWNGDPATIEYVRIGNYRKHLTYIYIYPKPDASNRYINRFDIGYEDEKDQWGDSITTAELVEEAEKRSRVVPAEVVVTAKKMFTNLLDYLKANDCSLCYDEDDASVFVGPKDLKWNVGADGNLPAPENNLRKHATHDLMKKFADQGHLATEVMTHVHVSDSDETFRTCNLTYAV